MLEGFQRTVERALIAVELAWYYLMSKLAFQELMKPIKQRGRKKRYSLHIYSFKKFGFTKIADILGELAAHAIAGHKRYLITYYKKSRTERAGDYRKVIPKLSLFSNESDAELKEKAKETIEKLPKEALLEILKIGKKHLKE